MTGASIEKPDGKSMDVASNTLNSLRNSPWSLTISLLRVLIISGAWGREKKAQVKGMQTVGRCRARHQCGGQCSRSEWCGSGGRL